MGRVVKVRPHARGEHIWLADVDIGTGSLLQIVWGGVQIVAEGSLVPVAKPGAWLPATKGEHDYYKIRRRRYRGEISEGMLCSIAELGWDLAVADRVALLDGFAGLQPGDSLDDVGDAWPRVVRKAVDFLTPEESAASESPKMLQTA